MTRRHHALHAAAGRRTEILAALGGVVIVLLVATTLHACSTATLSPSARHLASSPWVSALTPGGAARAAAAYLVAFNDIGGGDGGALHKTIDTAVTGPLKTKLEHAFPIVMTALRARLGSSTAPAAFDGWPLGYRVLRFGPGHSTISIWHLDVAATSALRLVSSDFTTTTYALAWIDGAWRITDIRNAAGPTPPHSGASGAQIDEFAHAADEFTRYSYAP